jgi:hypothetical protein
MKKILILLTVLLVLVTSCKKDFLKVDETNPNTPSAVPANLVLSAALNNTARITTLPSNFSFIYLWYGSWCISGGYSQPLNLTQYNLLNSSYQPIWDNYYLNLGNYDYIEKISTTDQSKPIQAIAKIMKAYIYQNLVDIYGNIPYTSALKAAQGGNFLKPAYDSQQSVYEDLVLQLDAAMALINTAPADAVELGKADIVYQGDMSLWLKFANTLKLRILINQSGMTGRDGYIKTALATSPNTPDSYIGVGEGALSNPGYLHSTDKMNPFWETFYKQDDSQQSDGLTYYMAGQDACDFLETYNDPRKLLIFNPIGTTTNVKGNYFGTLVLQNVASTSSLGPGMVKAYNMPAPLLTDFESLFIQAEAATRGYLTGGDAKSLYEGGVTQSVVYFGGSAADAGNYLSQGAPLVTFDAATNKIQTIITQKWIALNGVDAMPLWTDYRRTGFPDFIHFTADPAKLNATPPVRLLYPQTELSSNADNVAAQGDINLFTSKIFWQNR